MSRKPVSDKIKGLRQRRRSDGSWRVWWEPNANERAAGFEPVELDEMRPAWSVKQARDTNTAAAKAMRGEGQRPTGPAGRTMDALIADYRGSRFYLDRKADTRRGYNTCLNHISRKWGPHAAAGFTKPVIFTWYETLAKHSGKDYANQLVAMMSILMTHAERLGWRPENSNPCFRIGRMAPTRRDRVATWAEFDALVACADFLGMPAMAAAIGLATLCPPRQADVINARAGEFDDYPLQDQTGETVNVLVWTKRLSKRGNMNAAPVHPMIAARVRKLLDACTGPGDYLLKDHDHTRPFDRKLFSKRWRTIRARVASGPSPEDPDVLPAVLRHALPDIKTLQFRDLRRTFGVWARQGGASKDDVGDVLGNSAGQNDLLAGIYMPPSLIPAARAVFAVQRPAEDDGAQQA